MRLDDWQHCESCGGPKWWCDDCGLVFCFTPTCRQFQEPALARSGAGACLTRCRRCA